MALGNHRGDKNSLQGQAGVQVVLTSHPPLTFATVDHLPIHTMPSLLAAARKTVLIVVLIYIPMVILPYLPFACHAGGAFDQLIPPNCPADLYFVREEHGQSFEEAVCPATQACIVITYVLSFNALLLMYIVARFI